VRSLVRQKIHENGNPQPFSTVIIITKDFPCKLNTCVVYFNPCTSSPKKCWEQNKSQGPAFSKENRKWVKAKTQRNIITQNFISLFLMKYNIQRKNNCKEYNALLLPFFSRIISSFHVEKIRCFYCSDMMTSTMQWSQLWLGWHALPSVAIKNSVMCWETTWISDIPLYPCHAVHDENAERKYLSKKQKSAVLNIYIFWEKNKKVKSGTGK